MRNKSSLKAHKITILDKNRKKLEILLRKEEQNDKSFHYIDS